MHSTYLYLLSKNLFTLSIIIFSTISIFGQQATPKNFTKPSWLKCYEEDSKYKNIERRILYEYGAVYLSKAFVNQKDTDKIPCLFANGTQISEYAKFSKQKKNRFKFGEFYLNPIAKKELLEVIKELGGEKFVIRNCNSKPTLCENGLNKDWAFRDYRQTMCNWTDQKQCDQKELLSDDEKLVVLDPTFDEAKTYYEQATSRPMILKFAVPGGSQHHLGLAIDVNNGTGNSDIKNCKNNNNCRVCGKNCIASLEKHGWYRTVRYDPYHFTFLGFTATELPKQGLKRVTCKDRKDYWVPRVEDYESYPNWRCENAK